MIGLFVVLLSLSSAVATIKVSVYALSEGGANGVVSSYLQSRSEGIRNQEYSLDEIADWIQKQGNERLEAYWKEKNSKSIDGFETGI